MEDQTILDVTFFSPDHVDKKLSTGYEHTCALLFNQPGCL